MQPTCLVCGIEIGGGAICSDCQERGQSARIAALEAENKYLNAANAAQGRNIAHLEAEAARLMEAISAWCIEHGSARDGPGDSQ